MLLNDTDSKEVQGAAPSHLHTSPSLIAADDGVVLATTQSPTQSEVLLSSQPLLRLHVRPPPTAISTSTSSLDSCLAAFPGVNSSQVSSTAMPLPPTSSNPKIPPPIVTSSPLHSSTVCTFNADSPLLSAIVDMSECSTLNESAVASSDDAMCASPLLAEIKDRRFSAKREAFLQDALQSHPSLSYIRALGHWQEQAFPPVPTIPAQYQESSGQCSSGWTMCTDTDGDVSTLSSEPTGESIKGDSTSKKDIYRLSMTNSSRITIDPMSTSGNSMDTSVNTQISTIRSSKRDSLLKISSLGGDKRRGPQSLSKESKSPFAFNAEKNDSASSLISRGTSRPDTASKRIAFAPSVRIGTSTPSKDFIARKSSQSKYVGNILGDEMRSNATKDQSILITPSLSPCKEDVQLLMPTKNEKSFLPRPSTAPHPNRRAAAENTFRKLLRPISRQNNRDGINGDGFSNFSRPKTAKSKMDDSDTISVESRQSIHAPLHLDGPFGRRQPSCMTTVVEATRVQELPRPPRAFYPGTLILVKDQEQPPPVETYKSRVNHNLRHEEQAQKHQQQQNQQDKGGCPSYMDAVAEDARHEQNETPTERDDVVWCGEPMQIKSNDKRGGLKKLKRAVIKVGEAFSTRMTNEKSTGQQIDYGDHQGGRLTSDGLNTIKSKKSSRPSTAPSLASSVPRWGSNSFNKVAKIVTRYEQASQPSILIAPTREKHNIESLRNLEEIRKRNTPWDDQSNPNQSNNVGKTTTNTRQDHLELPHYTRPSTKRESHKRENSRAVQQGQSSSSALPSSSVQSGQHAYRVALVPVARVSQDQLKRMQPVKIVKYPAVDVA